VKVFVAMLQIVQKEDVADHVVVRPHVFIKVPVRILLVRKPVYRAHEALGFRVLLNHVLLLSDGTEGIHDLANEDVGQHKGPDHEEG
jgi:hypothetical protein